MELTAYYNSREGKGGEKLADDEMQARCFRKIEVA